MTRIEKMTMQQVVDMLKEGQALAQIALESKDEARLSDFVQWQQDHLEALRFQGSLATTFDMVRFDWNVTLLKLQHHVLMVAREKECPGDCEHCPYKDDCDNYSEDDDDGDDGDDVPPDGALLSAEQILAQVGDPHG